MQFSLSTVFYVVLFIAFLTLRNLCQKQWCLTFHGILNENSLLYLKPLSPYVLSRGHGVQPWSVLETNPHTSLQDMLNISPCPWSSSAKSLFQPKALSHICPRSFCSLCCNTTQPKTLVSEMKLKWIVIYTETPTERKVCAKGL